MVIKNNKTKTLNVVNFILKEYFLNKNHSEEEANNQIDLINQGLYQEVWDLNKKRITDELGIVNEKYLKDFEEKLKIDYKKKDKVNSFKKMVGLLFEGVFVAILVGLMVNQITDLVTIFKKSINDSINVSLVISTIIIIVIIVIILSCLVGKYFVDKLRELYNDIYK